MILPVYKHLLAKENYNFISSSGNKQLFKTPDISNYELDKTQIILDKIIQQFITNYDVYLDLMEVEVSDETKKLLKSLKSSHYDANLYRLSFEELVLDYDQLFYLVINNLFIQKICLSSDEIKFFNDIKNIKNEIIIK
ncbi:hypothetical protein QVZ41_03375 [Wenyingzhuangia sp. chi5]|uniref:Uncharacterized protein n=1 Tax=Wenyingzhuangia gilva TaxID=3057677 RepID=A0ABT8VPJ2_9FLAO|nr:hypothetical protein [Wenyingzhuangia sp. chi5]MDO3693889.1 hypothetical protein [Wenyingzhuangia sp. chi5]